MEYVWNTCRIRVDLAWLVPVGVCVALAVPDGLWPKSLVCPGEDVVLFANCALCVGLPPLC